MALPSPWSLLLGAALVGGGLAACASEDRAPEPPPSRRTPTPQVCSLPAGLSGNPTTIEEAVALLNALPRPVSVACVLGVLDRPLHIDLSAGNFSLQPAFGENNPRVFVILGPLVVSVVPKGKGSTVMEFGVRRAGGQSLKAEIAFPVTEEITPEAPYARVSRDGGTVCRVCHFVERRDEAISFTTAYASNMIPPAPEDRVDPTYLDGVIQRCDPASEPDRCAIFDAIFGPADVIYEPLQP